MVEAEKNFKTAIRDFPEHAEFLSKCHLELSFGSSQFSLKKSISIADICERITLVKAGDLKDKFICLNQHLKDAQMAAKKAQGQEAARIKEKIEKLEKEMNSFFAELEFNDEFDIFVVFPSIQHEIIQQLKGHPLVKANQCMCKACVKVFFY